MDSLCVPLPMPSAEHRLHTKECQCRWDFPPSYHTVREDGEDISKTPQYVIIIIIIIITFQTANQNWESQMAKTQRPQQGRQPSKERENFRKKRKQL